MNARSHAAALVQGSHVSTDGCDGPGLRQDMLSLLSLAEILAPGSKADCPVGPRDDVSPATNTAAPGSASCDQGLRGAASTPTGQRCINAAQRRRSVAGCP